MTNLLKRLPLLFLSVLFFLYGCSGKKAGVKTPKEAADLFVQSLKENDFKKFTVLVPTKSDAHDIINEMNLPKERKEKAQERADEAFSKKDPMGEMKKIFDNVRDHYPAPFWQGVKIVSYEGIEPSKEGGLEGAEVFIKLKSSNSTDTSALELKLGEIIKVKGRWLLMTEPRWI